MVPPVKIEVLKVGKKPESTPVAEPTTTDIIGKLEQTKKEPTKESSNASMIIQ